MGSTLVVRREFLEFVDSKVEQFYRPFLLKRGAKVRHYRLPLWAPQVLAGGNQNQLLSSYPFPHALHGSIRGRSPLTNARQHSNQKLVVTLDLADFYPSVSLLFAAEAVRERVLPLAAGE